MVIQLYNKSKCLTYALDIQISYKLNQHMKYKKK